MEIPVFATWQSTKKQTAIFLAEIVHILLSDVSGRKLFSFWPPTASATSENVSPCWKNNRRQRGKQLFFLRLWAKKRHQFQNYNSGKVLLSIWSFHFCLLLPFLLSEWQQEAEMKRLPPAVTLGQSVNKK